MSCIFIKNEKFIAALAKNISVSTSKPRPASKSTPLIFHPPDCVSAGKSHSLYPGLILMGTLGWDRRKLSQSTHLVFKQPQRFRDQDFPDLGDDIYP